MENDHDVKEPKIKRRKGKDKLKEKKEKNGKYNTKHIRINDSINKKNIDNNNK